MEKKIDLKKIAKTIGITMIILLVIAMFLTPIINLTYKSIPGDEISVLPTGEYIYLWGILLEINVGDISAIIFATDIENFINQWQQKCTCNEH